MKSKIVGLITVLMTVSFLAIGPVSAAEYDCRGTEPFWAVTVTTKKLSYLNPEMNRPTVLAVASVRQAAGRTPNYVSVIKTKYSTLTLTSDTTCSDGMSELSYTHRAVYDIGGKILEGCCNLK